MRIMAIDPGNVESGWCLIDAETHRPIDFGKAPNSDLRDKLLSERSMSEDYAVVIEMIGHYGTGMPAGKTIFDTCVWIGRFIEAAGPRLNVGGVRGTTHAELVLRPTIKAHHCGNPKAKDANVAQALRDRFAPDVRNHGKGTKDEPGWFYGFHRDIWAAYALAVYAADLGATP